MTASEDIAAPTSETTNPNAVDVSTEKNGCLMKEIIKEGEGEYFPPEGCKVTVEWEGRLPDGTVFETRKRTESNPQQFLLGLEVIVKPVDVGVASMKKNETALFTCTGEYAITGAGTKEIPPSETILYEVTLLDWTPVDLSKAKDSGVLRMGVLTVGKGYMGPVDGSYVNIHITGRYEGKEFEDRDVSFDLGEGYEVGVVEGIEMALLKFKKKEKSVLRIAPEYAFKEAGNEELGIPPNATVEYIVKLKSFEQDKKWSMSDEEVLEQAKIVKEKATNHFKAKKYDVAMRFYNRAIEYVNASRGSNETVEAERKAMILAIRLNLGLVHLKMNQCYNARNECDKALEMDPENVKGLFRRGQAYLGMDEPELAKVDFEAVLKLEPTNKLASDYVLVCNSKMKEHRKREKKLYSNMFEKFAKKDEEEEQRKRKEWEEGVSEIIKRADENEGDYPCDYLLI